MGTHAQHCSHVVLGDAVLLGQHMSPSPCADIQQTLSAHESQSHLMLVRSWHAACCQVPLFIIKQSQVPCFVEF